MFKGHGDVLKNVSEFIVSKEALRFNQIKSFNPVDDPEVNLSRERRNLAELERQLKVTRGTYKEKTDALKGDWKNLGKSQLELRNSFVTFNKFIKDNFVKRGRADKLSRDAQKARLETEEKVKNMRKKIKITKADKAAMENQIREFRIYTNFLDNVVDLDPTFRNPDDVVMTFETLAETRQLLGKRQAQCLLQVETALNAASNQTANAQLKIMGLKTQLAHLTHSYEIASAKSRKWEAVVSKIKDSAGTKMYEHWLVKEAIWNTYISMCKRMYMLPQIPQGHIKEQIVFIKKTLKQLEGVRKALEDVASLKLISSSQSKAGRNKFSHSSVRIKNK